MLANLLERAATALSAVALAYVAFGAAFFSFVPRSSGVPESVVVSLTETARWQRARLRPPPAPVVANDPASQPRRPEVTALPEPVAPPPVETWPPGEPGVVTRPVEVVPAIVCEKYRAYQDACELAEEGGGELSETPRGSGYRLTWIDERSQLRHLLGLRPGDVILSVNGHPIGASVVAGKELYDLLRNERRFLVRLLRGGEVVALPFEVR